MYTVKPKPHCSICLVQSTAASMNLEQQQQNVFITM